MIQTGVFESRRYRDNSRSRKEGLHLKSHSKDRRQQAAEDNDPTPIRDRTREKIPQNKNQFSPPIPKFSGTQNQAYYNQTPKHYSSSSQNFYSNQNTTPSSQDQFITTLHSENLQGKFNSQNSKNSEDFFTKKTTYQKPSQNDNENDNNSSVSPIHKQIKIQSSRTFESPDKFSKHWTAP